MTQDPAAKTSALLEALWQRNLPVLRSRLSLLESAAVSAGSGSLGEELRHEAAATAHKLAGSLGMFGFKDGTDLARRLEGLLEGDEPIPVEGLEALTRELRASLRLE